MEALMTVGRKPGDDDEPWVKTDKRSK